MARNKTPKSVKEGARRAEELHEEVYGAAPDDTLEAEKPENPEPAESGENGDIQPVEVQAEAGEDGDTLSDSPGEDSGGDTESSPEPAPEPAPQEDWKAKAEEAEQRYRSLQGIFNATNNEVRELKAQLEQLMAAPKEPEKEPEEKPVVTDDELADYGEDLVSMVRRIAAAEAAKATKDLTPQIERIEGRVTESVEKQNVTTVYSQLDADVPDWRAINKSQEFLEWLAQPDPYSGTFRKNLLGAAFESGDAGRVVAFFKGFITDNATVAPQPAPVTKTPAPPKANGELELDQLAGPKAGASSAEQVSADVSNPTVNRADIAKFYQEVTAGRYKNNPERQREIEAMIAAAMQEGRVR